MVREPAESDRRMILQLRDAVVFQRLPVVLLDQRRGWADSWWPGMSRRPCAIRFHGNADFQNSVAVRRLPDSSDAFVLEQVHPLAVDAEFELLAGNEGADAEFWIENVYSPSAGKMWRTSIPPRVPNGNPSSDDSVRCRWGRDRSFPSASSSRRRPCGRSSPRRSRRIPAESERSSTSRRCCRSLWPNRPAAAASRHRLRCRAGRGWHWRIRCG